MAADAQADGQVSQTAQEYILSQLQLEAEAREALPYQFDSCTKLLGPLRQSLFACLTCTPPDTKPQGQAGLCYSCSISCHGEHDLVELFSKRNFVCDCGTTRLPDSAPCMLRSHPTTGLKGNVTVDVARDGNLYNHNFSGRFCSCGERYDPALEKGTMFQCLGLGTVEDGGCGEDWYHPECLLGIPRAQPVKDQIKDLKNPTGVPETISEEPNTDDSAANGNDITQPTDSVSEEQPLPDGFPAEDEFEHLICFKCVAASPWIKQYAGSPGFIPVNHNRNVREQDGGSSQPVTSMSGSKRKADNEDDSESISIKRCKVDTASGETSATAAAVTATTTTAADTTAPPAADSAVSDNGPSTTPKHSSLPPAPPGPLSLFLKEDFRDHFCKCPSCFPNLAKHPQLLEEEEAYEPPMSQSQGSNEDEQNNGGGSVSGAGSLLERGEAALSTMDRMRAIEGAMAYNHLKDKVKAFLQPFADSGTPVGAEDVKAYFARLRGDEDAIRAAASGADGDGGGGDNRREQSGY